MKSLLLTIGRAAVSIRNRRAELWKRRGRLHRIGEAAPQRRRRPICEERDPFRRQRGRMLENYGERGVDGDHGVLGAVVVLHGGVCAQCFLALRARVLGVVPASITLFSTRFDACALIYHAFARSGAGRLLTSCGEPASAAERFRPPASRAASHRRKIASWCLAFTTLIPASIETAPTRTRQPAQHTQPCWRFEGLKDRHTHR